MDVIGPRARRQLVRVKPIKAKTGICIIRVRTGNIIMDTPVTLIQWCQVPIAIHMHLMVCLTSAIHAYRTVTQEWCITRCLMLDKFLSTTSIQAIRLGITLRATVSRITLQDSEVVSTLIMAMSQADQTNPTAKRWMTRCTSTTSICHKWFPSLHTIRPLHISSTSFTSEAANIIKWSCSRTSPMAKGK